GVSYSSSTAWPSTDRRAPSTCRVVLGRWETSPKPTSRVRVRSSEVLPTLVWPTTASFSALVMSGLQPGQRCGTAMGQAQLFEGRVPVSQALAIQRFAGRRLQQPYTGHRGAARQFAQQRQGAAIRRAARVAGNQQARRWESGQLVEQTPPLLAVVENAGIGDALGQCGRPGS